MTETANGKASMTGLVPIEHNMKFKALMVPPCVAEEWLKKNHPRNRKPKERRIGLYAQDIVNHQWYLTHEAVGFDEDGFLIDGQNRLEAIIKAGEPAPLLVVFNAPKKSFLMANQGASRDVRDMAKIQKFSDDMPTITRWIGCARTMLLGIKMVTIKRANPPTNQEVLAFLKAHQEAVGWALHIVPNSSATRGLARAPVHAVLARAFYQTGAKRIRTEAFATVLVSGLMENTKTDSAAIRLRNWLMDNIGGRRRREGMQVEPQIIYAKTQTALKAFIDERNVENLKETTSEELFKLPGE